MRSIIRERCARIFVDLDTQSRIETGSFET